MKLILLMIDDDAEYNRIYFDDVLNMYGKRIIVGDHIYVYDHFLYAIRVILTRIIFLLFLRFTSANLGVSINTSRE